MERLTPDSFDVELTENERGRLDKVRALVDRIRAAKSPEFAEWIKQFTKNGHDFFVMSGYAPETSYTEDDVEQMIQIIPEYIEAALAIAEEKGLDVATDILPRYEVIVNFGNGTSAALKLMDGQGTLLEVRPVEDDDRARGVPEIDYSEIIRVDEPDTN